MLQLLYTYTRVAVPHKRSTHVTLSLVIIRVYGVLQKYRPSLGRRHRSRDHRVRV